MIKRVSNSLSPILLLMVAPTTTEATDWIHTNNDMLLIQSISSYVMPEYIATTQHNEVLGELNSYIHLAPDWDGYGGIPPLENAVTDALTFLTNNPDYTKSLKPMLSSNGVVGLYIDEDELYLDIEFDGTGSFSYYIELDDDDFIAEEDIPIDNPNLPQNLIKSLLTV
ncbi:MAG: hypothetical protein AB2696_01645 [Candidatus Thiodiazotropha sp.]|nr:hypothetical protein [Candidatus Thiodiazotropha sp. (ex Lucina pensylvanica)]